MLLSPPAGPRLCRRGRLTPPPPTEFSVHPVPLSHATLPPGAAAVFCPTPGGCRSWIPPSPDAERDREWPSPAPLGPIDAFHQACCFLQPGGQDSSVQAGEVFPSLPREHGLARLFPALSPPSASGNHSGEDRLFPVDVCVPSRLPLLPTPAGPLPPSAHDLPTPPKGPRRRCRPFGKLRPAVGPNLKGSAAKHWLEASPHYSDWP